MNIRDVKLPPIIPPSPQLPLPLMRLARSLSTWQFSKINSLSQAKQLLSCDILVNSKWNVILCHSQPRIKEVSQCETTRCYFDANWNVFLCGWYRFVQQIPHKRQITPLSHAHITHSHIFSPRNGIGFTVMKTVTIYFAMSHMCYCPWQCM